MSPAASPAENIALARTAIRQVEANADTDWTAVAHRAAIYIARTQAVFCTDDIWEAIERHYPDTRTHDNRAMGPLMLWMTRNGLARIQTCDHCGTRKVTKPARRDTSHGTDVAWYTSLIEAT